jgi:hypothetical protein
MNQLIEKLRKEFWDKPYPSYILKKIGEEKLIEFEKEYEVDHDALWIGAHIADMFISEAVKLGAMPQHVPMALDFAREIFKQNPAITDKQQKIIIEIIGTHHGGEQKFIESKIFKNADCFKFLEPKGVFNFFADIFNREQDGNEEERITKAIQAVMYKVEEKYSLVDLNKKVQQQAFELYSYWQLIFNRSNIEYKVPNRYQAN